MTSSDESLTNPSLIKALATGTTYSSLDSDDLRLSFSVLLAEANCALVTYFMLMAVKATETITDADSFVREWFSFPPVEEFAFPSLEGFVSPSVKKIKTNEKSEVQIQ